MTTSKLNIFVSHASEDHDFVWELYKKMKKDLADIANIFVDDWEIKVGDSIIRKIDEASQSSDFFIIVLSKHSIGKEWIRREIDIAFNRLIQGKSSILPIWLEVSEEEIPPILLPIKAAIFDSRAIIDEKEYQKLIEPIINHEKAKILLQFEEEILGNIQHLDIILQKDEPTRMEVKFAIDLIKTNFAYQKYFFLKLKSLKWIEILKLEGFFAPEKAPGPEPADKEGFCRFPYWIVLDYLERVSEQVNQPSNEKYIDQILQIIKEVSEYHKKIGKLDNYHIWSSFIRILSNLPNGKISIEIIDLIPVWLDSKFDTLLQTEEIVKKLLPKFLTGNKDDIKKAEKIIEHLTETKKENGKTFLKADLFWLKEFFIKHYQVLAEKCTVEIIKVLSDRLKELISSDGDGTFYSFYDYEEEDYKLGRPVEFLSYVLSKIMAEKAQKSPNELRIILKEFLQEQKLIFPKIALYIIAHNIESLKDIFWEKIKSEDGSEIFEKTFSWGDELKRVLEKLGPLTEEQRKLLKGKIEQGVAKSVEDLDNVDESEKNKLKTIGKQEIYRALSYDDTFKTLYEKLKEITGVDAELHPAIGKIEVRTGWGESPLTVEQILEMENAELANYLLEFKTVNFWEGPTVEALADTLKVAVKTKPEKFTKSLETFLNVGYLYVTRILDGLTDALIQNMSIDYENVLRFIEDYINRDEFWEDKFVVETQLRATHTWVIGRFCQFITEGIQNRTHPLPEALFEKLESIIHFLLEKLQSEEKDEEISDYVFYSSNTPLGRVIETYIKFILKMLQSSHDKKESLKSRFIEEYKKLLERSVIESYTFLGLYLLYFYYHIDKNFVEDIVKSLRKENELWEAFMQGYLFNGKISNEIYELLRDHYAISLQYNFNTELFRERLVEHISLAYLMGLEDLGEESLFKELISKFNPEDINRIIWFFERQKGYLETESERSEQFRKKVLDFWAFVYEKLRHKDKENGLSEKEKEILSKSASLAGFLPELTEPYIDWLKLSAKYINDPITFSDFLDDLQKFITGKDRIQTAKIIGEILLETKPFIYPEDKIKSIVEHLCKISDNEVKTLAVKICEKYFNAGYYYFLKEICDKC